MRIKKNQKKKDEHIDRNWITQKMVEDYLYKWLSASRSNSGFFVNSLNRRWESEKNQKATLVSQTRLLFVMSIGYDLTKDKRFLVAIQKGADFLLTNFKANQFGKWFWSVTFEGNILNRKYNEYGHAFVIFGLSHAFRITGDVRYRKAAEETWRSLEILKKLKQFPGCLQNRKFSQNPLMHTVEALLTLHEVTGDKSVLDDAFFITKFVFDKLYQNKKHYLPELYVKTICHYQKKMEGISILAINSNGLFC